MITSILDDLAPVTESTVHVRPYCQFYDDECRQARRVAQRAEQVYRRSKGTDKENYALKSWRSALKSSRRLVKLNGRQYWRRSLHSTESDTKRTWKFLNMLLGEGDKPVHAHIPTSVLMTSTDTLMIRSVEYETRQPWQVQRPSPHATAHTSPCSPLRHWKRCWPL